MFKILSANLQILQSALIHISFIIVLLNQLAGPFHMEQVHTTLFMISTLNIGLKLINAEFPSNFEELQDSFAVMWHHILKCASCHNITQFIDFGRQNSVCKIVLRISSSSVVINRRPFLVKNFAFFFHIQQHLLELFFCPICPCSFSFQMSLTVLMSYIRVRCKKNKQLIVQAKTVQYGKQFRFMSRVSTVVHATNMRLH